MKKSALFALAASALVLSSCNDMLEKSPIDSFENGPEFWNNANLVQNYSNTFFENYAGYGYGDSGGWFYFKSLSDDQANPNFDNWEFTTVPNSSSYWGTNSAGNYHEIRRANYMLQGLENTTLAESVANNYRAIARLNRAWSYYQLVRMYGNVQWQDAPVMDADPNGSQADIIYGARDDRDVVMDNVLADLDFAIANLSSQSAANSWSKDMALAMKSDVCLYEGTYCKYRTQAENGKAADATRAARYLQECVSANETLINSGRYNLSANYGDVYNSLDLSSNKEVIFWRKYVKDVQGHSTVDYTTGSTAQSGITKDAVDAFLFLDGKPLATTTLDTDDKPVVNQYGDLSLTKMLSVRDKRLSVIIDSIACFKGYGWARAIDALNNSNTAQMTSSTGYTVHKYDNFESEQIDERNDIGKGWTDAPIYWMSVILLNQAEAKAELGNISQADLDATVNKLRDRAGLPHMTLTPDADPANNHGVSNLLWEVRRERRCELMTDNWFRYWDLVRWHQLDKLDSSRYPNINLGVNVSSVADADVATVNGYIQATSATRTWDSKYYFFPIPSNTINNLPESMQAGYQNPGW